MSSSLPLPSPSSHPLPGLQEPAPLVTWEPHWNPVQNWVGCFLPKDAHSRAGNMGERGLEREKPERPKCSSPACERRQVPQLLCLGVPVRQMEMEQSELRCASPMQATR